MKKDIGSSLRTSKSKFKGIVYRIFNKKKKKWRKEEKRKEKRKINVELHKKSLSII